MLPGVDSRDRAGSCLSIDDVDLQQSFDIQIREIFSDVISEQLQTNG